jgi:hypothetical protein
VHRAAWEDTTMLRALVSLGYDAFFAGIGLYVIVIVVSVFVMVLISGMARDPFSTGPRVTTRVIAVSGDLQFCNVPVGSSGRAILHIANTGNAPLTLTGVRTPLNVEAVVRANVSRLTIGPGASRDVVVTFAPTLARLYYGDFVVDGNQTAGRNRVGIFGGGLVLARAAANRWPRARRSWRRWTWIGKKPWA